mmetsp:Transcript_42025/g.116025  ORF Transcript_42025/g.116025 Transcript_42025/m.116025 type:complete len:246 (+) Transcript_42025:732-1469(+)
MKRLASLKLTLASRSRSSNRFSRKRSSEGCPSGESTEVRIDAMERHRLFGVCGSIDATLLTDVRRDRPDAVVHAEEREGRPPGAMLHAGEGRDRPTFEKQEVPMHMPAMAHQGHEAGWRGVHNTPGEPAPAARALSLLRETFFELGPPRSGSFLVPDLLCFPSHFIGELRALQASSSEQTVESGCWANMPRGSHGGIGSAVSRPEERGPSRAFSEGCCTPPGTPSLASSASASAVRRPACAKARA